MRGVTFDITERRELEERVRQQQKMETIGRLAAGVAHDFNNLLAPIMGHAEIALEDIHNGQLPSAEDLTLICDAARSAASLTRRLLAFSRQEIIRPETIDLNKVARELEMMLRRLVGEHIAVTMRLSPEPAVVHADRGQLEQVLLNLAVNARDAMPHGGPLVIEIVNIPVAQACAHGLERRPDGYVALTVSDTGHGMTSEVKAHLFEPFFTTKDIGKGTGIGMSTIQAIVKQSGGAIEVESEPGRGTIVRVCLPQASAEKKRRITTVLAQTLPPIGTETILLVEDSAQLREFARRALVRLGYRTNSLPGERLSCGLTELL